MQDIIYIDSIMYIVKNVEKRFFRVLRSITYTNKTDRHDITGTIVKRDAKHHIPNQAINKQLKEFYIEYY